MVFHNEPLLYSLVVMSVFFMVFSALTITVVGQTKASDKGCWGMFSRLLDVVLKGFSMSYMIAIFICALLFIATMDPVYTNPDEADEYAKDEKLRRLIYAMVFYGFSLGHFVLMYMNLHGDEISTMFGLCKGKPVTPAYEAVGEGNAVDIAIRMNTDQVTHDRLFSAPDQKPTSVNPVVFGVHVGMVLLNYGMFFCIQFGFLKDRAVTGIHENWAIINATTASMSFVLLVTHLALTGNSASMYRNYAGHIFGSSTVGKVSLWFLPWWFIFAFICVELSTAMMFFNDYNRLFLYIVMVIIVPLAQALATGVFASWHYFSTLARTFFFAMFWHAIVPYSALFPTNYMKDGSPTDAVSTAGAARRWYYWFMDWDNTNFVYTYLNNAGETKTYLEGAHYFVSVVGLVCMVWGLVWTSIQAWESNDLFRSAFMGSKKEVDTKGST